MTSEALGIVHKLTLREVWWEVGVCQRLTLSHVTDNDDEAPFHGKVDP